MENITNNEISIEEYEGIISKIDWLASEEAVKRSGIDSKTNEEKLIETHKKLIDKSCKGEFEDENIKDCSIDFINQFLTRDWGRSIVYQYSEGAERFIKSAYLSDYFKKRLKDMFIEMDNVAGDRYLYTPNIEKIFNSSKTFNEMSEEEIKYIFSQIKVYTASNNRYHEVMGEKVDYQTAQGFLELLFKLDGDGVTACLKDDNYYTKSQLADQILLTSGLNNRASYYSGRGVNYGDLSEKNLSAIFNKLLKLDIDYATNFVKMVLKMETLGATEFITSFIAFADNGFKFNSLDIDSCNVSLEGLPREAINMIRFISMIEIKNRGNDKNTQVMASNQMKIDFITEISPILKEINPDFDELTDQTYSNYQNKKI